MLTCRALCSKAATKSLERGSERRYVFTGAFLVSALQVVCTHVQEHKYDNKYNLSENRIQTVWFKNL